MISNTTHARVLPSVSCTSKSSPKPLVLINSWIILSLDYLKRIVGLCKSHNTHSDVFSTTSTNSNRSKIVINRLLQTPAPDPPRPWAPSPVDQDWGLTEVTGSSSQPPMPVGHLHRG